MSAMIAAAWAIVCWVGAAESRGADVFTDRVAPILERHCVRCHGGDKTRAGLSLTSGPTAMRGSEHGPVITPGDPDASKLVAMITGEAGGKPKMPQQGDPLTADEVATIRAWIADGAKWPGGLTLHQKTGADGTWWSLRPVVEPAVPRVPDDGGWVRNPIDAFVLAKLREAKLGPSPEADRRTLIRRLSFDLTGLPPTPSEIDAFVADTSADAYEKAADRLLDSPAYGERWARHWLDVARYGESDGFERNGPRPNMWHYRDWVIRALNADLPYDRFVRMQVAGDLEDPTYDGRAAVGFLVAGVHNTVVGSSPRMQKLAREDELEEIIGTTAQALLGITAQCARCHDHKFDPVTLREYYQLTAAIGGVNHGELDVPRAGDRERMAAIDAEIERIDRDVAVIEEPARKRVLDDRRKGAAEAPKPPQPIARWEFDGDLRDSVGKMHAQAINGAKVENGALVVDGSGYAQTAPIGVDLAEKTLEAWVKLDDLNQGGGGVMGVQTAGGQYFDAIVYAEKEPKRWMAGSNFFVRTQSFGGADETDADQRAVHVAVVYQADGTILAYRDGKPYGQAYRSPGVQKFNGDATNVLLGIRHTPAGGNKMLKARIERAQLYDRALSPDAIAASAGAPSDFVSDEQLAARLGDGDRTRRTELVARHEKLRADRVRLEPGDKAKVYTVIARNPGPRNVLGRGDIDSVGELVSPGGIAVVPGGGADWGLPADAADSDRRRKLAEWITHPDNPLFGRTIVNRLWHYHFGVGIVDTPNDLGFNGGRPSHPELLDWLAARLRAERYSLKAMHRLIVTSAAYRQASTPNDAAMKLDAANRLLWRRTPQRMDGETLRDTLLVAAAKLNPAMGGPGYVDVKIDNNNGTTYYHPFDADKPELDRRTVYRFSPRGGRSALLDTFDCPDPANTAPRRAVTTTPLQALSLMNNAFVLRMAAAIAARAEREAGPALADRAALVYRLLLGRSPLADEAADAARFAESFGLPALARALINTSEFVIIE